MRRSFVIGVLGMFPSIYGVYVGSAVYQGELGLNADYVQSMCFASGSLLLCISAYMEDLELFAWLEVVSLVAAFLGLLNIHAVLKAGLPTVVALIAITILYRHAYARSTRLRGPDAYLHYGVAGMLLAAASYSTRYEELFIGAGLFLGYYAYRGVKHNPLNWIWVILNQLYILAALFSLGLGGLPGLFVS